MTVQPDPRHGLLHHLWLAWWLPLAILLSWLFPSEAHAATKECVPRDAGGTTFLFEEMAGDPILGAICLASGFRCVPPVMDGAPVYQLADILCDPEAGPCPIQVRLALQFPGNQQNGSTFRGMEVRWFFQSVAPSCSDPIQCGQASTCGKAGFGGATINTDRATFTATRNLSCADLRNTSQPLSLTAWACISASGCAKRLDVNHLDLDGNAVAAAIGCPAPPPTEGCNGDPTTSCIDCRPGGLGVGGGGAGSPPGGAGPGAGNGPGARLRYLAGGAGTTGFPGSAAWRVTLGRNWSHDYAERIVQDPDRSHVWLITRYATFREFSAPDAGGVYQTVSPSNEYRTLTDLGVGSGWELRGLDGSVDLYDDVGRWTGWRDRNGNPKDAHYDVSGFLSQVDMPDGRREDFTYDPITGKLASITEVGVDGTTLRTWSYTWSGDDLTRIDRPDGTALEYAYEDGRHPGYMTRMELVGTAGGRRLLRAWAYDAQGNAVESWRGETVAGVNGPQPGAGAVDLYSLGFDNPGFPAKTTVTDPLGKHSVYTLDRDTVSLNVKVTSIVGDCPVCGLPSPSTTLIYGDVANPMRPTREVDAKGHVTEMAYDNHGQMISKTEASGTSAVRMTTWTYHTTYPALPTQVSRPSVAGDPSMRETMWSYDPKGNGTGREILGAEAGGAFDLTTVMGYNVKGRLTLLDPPGFAATDQTSFTYDPARNDLVLLTRTDPLVGTTQFGYDAFNRRTSVVDPNGVETTTSYDALNRVTEVAEKGATPAEDLVTENVYDELGDLFQTVLPEHNVLEYGYDAAGRLLSVERKRDAMTPGERTLYTLDAMGHRTLKELQHWNGASWVTDSATKYEYSSGCHLDRVIQGFGSAEESITEYGYDCNENLESVWDGNHSSATDPPTQAYAYDELDRVVSVTQPWAGAGGGDAVTTYGYDVQDHLTSVTDAEGNKTTYTYSDRDLLTQEVSPVSGTTTYRYNDHGALISTTDARTVETMRMVDELDRVKFVDYPDPMLDTTYTYDDPAVAFSKGRLTAIGRNGASVDYRYDRFGRLTQDGQLAFSYDDNGNRTTVGYPDGMVATYTYDFADRQSGLAIDTGTVQTIVSASSYLPSGPLASLTLGNGLVETRSFDPRYHPSRVTVGTVFDWSFATDPVGNVTAVTDALDATDNRSYAYQDNHYFLTQGNGPWGNLAWTYDKIGNRLTETGPSDGPFTYTYEGNLAGGRTPRLVSLAPLPSGAGSGSITYDYDAAGDQVSMFRDGGEGGGPTDLLTYDDARRLATMETDTTPGQVALTYDGRGLLRDSRLTTPGTTDFEATEPVYGSEGLLYSRRRQTQHTIPASDGGPSVQTTDETGDVFYFAGRPVAILTRASGAADELLFLTTDHLGTPVLATGTSGSALWSGGFRPFGEPYNGVEATNVFLRLPGQWKNPVAFGYGSKGGFYYNVHRWYAPGIGRYSRSDPLHLRSGHYLYAYAMANPILFVDTLGLVVQRCCRNVEVNQFVDTVFQVFGLEHCFLKTDTVEAGMGPANNGPLPACPIGVKTAVVNHAGQSTEPGTHCVVVPNIDEKCVNKLLELGRPTGRWTPINQCNSFADDVLARCRIECPIVIPRFKPCHTFGCLGDR